MSFKTAAITPRIFPGRLEKNAESTLDAVLNAEKKGARLIVLPKNCFLGECGSLSQREDVSMAVWCTAINVMKKTNACICFAISFFGSTVGFIYDKGELRSTKVLDGTIELNNKHINTVGEYVIRDEENNNQAESGINDCLIKIEDEKILNICSPDYIADKNKIYKLSTAAKDYKKIFMVLPASYPSLMGGHETKLKEAIALSAENNCVVAICCSGPGESTAKYLRAGDKIIAQNGQILSCSDFDTTTAYADCYRDTPDADYKEIAYAEYKNITYSKNKNITFIEQVGSEKISKRIILPDYRPRYLPKKDEVPEIFDTLSRAIIGRMNEANADKVILGLSGGLDSTMTLLSALHTQKYGLAPADIICVTMPSQASSRRTKTNAERLIAIFKTTGINIPITTAVSRHLKQISHIEKDVVFENAQARERAQILLSLGNKYNALVLGTSDLSESALGFSTYGGDSLAHFNPNSSLTKGAIRRIINESTSPFFYCPPLFINEEAKKVLKNILRTPISPELLKNQHTEEILGDYRLHEYFLLKFMAYGQAGQSLILDAKNRFKEFDEEYIQKTYKTFITRFFKTRFKTNFACDGVMLTPFDFTDKQFDSGFSPELFL